MGLLRGNVWSFFLVLALPACGSDHGSGPAASQKGAGGTAAGGAIGVSGGASVPAGGAGATMGGGGAAIGGGTSTGPRACDPGKAQPFMSLEGSANLLVDNADIIRYLAGDGNYVYYTEDGKGLQRVPMGGGTPELLIAQMDDMFFVLGPSYVYFGVEPSGSHDSIAVKRVPRDQWTATPEASGANVLYVPWAIDGDTIYGTDVVANQIWKQDFKTGKLDVVLANTEAEALVLNGGYLYFVETSTGEANIQRLNLAGGTPETVVHGSTYDHGGLLVSGQSVYWGDASGINVVTIGDPNSKKMLGGAGPGLFGGANAALFTLVGDRLYWNDDGGSAGWTRIDGSSCGLLFSDGFPATVAFAPGALYYDVFGFPNQIWRLAL